MSHLLIPGPATTTSATLWAAAIDERDEASALEVVTASGRRVGLGSWDGHVEGGKRRVAFRRVQITGLPERSRQRVELRRTGSIDAVASATLGTLPVALPGPEQRPFTVLLGSCFAQKTRRCRQRRADVQPSCRPTCART